MTDKKTKFHFEGKRKNPKGKEVYVLIELATRKQIEVDAGTYAKKEEAGEIEK